MKIQSPVRELPPVGNHPATLYKIIYIGTVDTEYQGQKKKSFKVSLTWELNNKTKVWKEGEVAKPISVSQVYTYSLGDQSALKPIVEGIVGGLTPSQAIDFDLDDLLGKQSLLQINHGVSENGKPKQLLTTSQFPEGLTPPKGFNQNVLLSYEKWDDEVFNGLPQWMKDEMMTTPEFKKMISPKAVEVPEMDIDFGTGEADTNDDPFA